jgi:hypothetical protein
MADDDVEEALDRYEESKALSLRGTPSYLVTLSTPTGHVTVRGLDARPLQEIVSGIGTTTVTAEYPMAVLEGVKDLVNFGAVVARPKDVVSISSFIEASSYDDDDDDDDDVDGDEDSDEADMSEEEPAVEHPMLKVNKGKKK